MKKSHLKTIRKAPFFKGISEQEFLTVLEQLDTQLKHYTADQVLVKNAQRIQRAGLILEGSVLLERKDYWNRNLTVETKGIGEVFLLEEACTHGRTSTSVKCCMDAVILWFNVKDILRLDSSCTYNTILIRNLMQMLANRNLSFIEQTRVMQEHSTKEKILAYLSYQARIQGSHEFDIPLDRKELAEYLSLDRASMSRALSSLQKEGWFTTRKNHFVLNRFND